MGGIYKEYFEQVRRFPVKTAFPIFPQDKALFWAAAVGELPYAIQQEVERVLTSNERATLRAILAGDRELPSNKRPRLIVSFDHKAAEAKIEASDRGRIAPQWEWALIHAGRDFHHCVGRGLARMNTLRWLFIE